jgi:hypothetical protein
MDLIYIRRRHRASLLMAEHAATAATRRIRARTRGGSVALGTAADLFDDDARQMDPSSLRRWAPGEDR